MRSRETLKEQHNMLTPGLISSDELIFKGAQNLENSLFLEIFLDIRDELHSLQNELKSIRNSNGDKIL